MKSIQIKTFGALLALICFVGCKKYDNPEPIFEEANIEVSTIRKVLVISVDGVSGQELKTIAPATLSALQKMSKYSYNASLDKSKTTDASSWVSMLTGVDYSSHLVSTPAFGNDLTGGGGDHDPIKQYSTVLDYLVTAKGTKTAFITPWTELRNYMNNFPDFLPVVSTDAAAKDSTVKVIADQNQVGAVFVNFREVAQAGNTGGFLASNTEYKAKIEQSDRYIGEILTALKNRKNFSKEDWLVVITANHGGSEADPKGGFLFVYNPKFKEFELQDRSILYALMPTQTVYAVAGDGGALYDGGDNTKDLTVQMQVKFNTSVSFPGFLTKSTNLSGNNLTGWYWMQANANWHINIGGSANGSGGRKELAVNVAGLNDYRWHTLTMVIKNNTATQKRVVKAYVDGKKFANEMDITDMRSMTNPNPLQLGVKNNSGNTAFYAANLAIFNVALEDDVIFKNFDLQDFSKHPMASQMVGFWPMNEQTGKSLKNKVSVAGASNLNFNTPVGPTWNDLVKENNVPKGVDIGISSQLKPASVAPMLMYWMNIPILTSYNMTGDSILDDFEIEFKGKN